MQRIGGVDFGAYFRAFGLYARNPWLLVGPLLAGLAGALLTMVFQPTPGALGGLTSGIAGLIVQLLDGFGLAVSIILADTAWRRGRAPFGDAWEEARRKAGDILMATIGYTFIVWVAGLIGSFLGNYGALALTAVAAYFFIYTIPAAAIGGIPGGAALQVSLERVQRSYANTLVLGIVFIAFTALFPVIWEYAALGLASVSELFASNAVVQLLGALIKAIGLGYLALVIAKAYNDASYGRRF